MKIRRTISVSVEKPRPSQGRLWRQIAEGLAWEIDLGRVPAGGRVPATRTLARELRVSRNTVSLAYDELTSLGYLHARVGDGSYVAPVNRRTRPPLFERRWMRCLDPDGNRLMLIR